MQKSELGTPCPGTHATALFQDMRRTTIAHLHKALARVMGATRGSGKERDG